MRRNLPVGFTGIRIFLILFILSFSLHDARAQLMNYNFSNLVGDFYSPGSSTGFLPSAPDGTAMVRVSDGGGGFSLTKPGTAIGSGSELQMFSSGNSSPNKMGISGFTPGRSSFVKFTMMFSGNSGGDWYFYMGRGASFTDDNDIDPAEAFTGIRWSIDDMGNISAWVHTASGWLDLPDGAFRQDREYTFEFYANNYSTQLYYDKNGGHYVPGGTCDIWINNILVVPHAEKMFISEDSDIDSWMIYNENSNNNGMMAIDDVQYSNNVTMKTLPVHFTQVGAFSVPGGIQVNWENSTEENMQHYEIERSMDALHFSSIGKTTANNNNGHAAYRFVDPSPITGVSYYRIRSVDKDGSMAFSQVIRINTAPGQNEVVLYPNPVHDRRVFIELSSLPKGSYQVVVNDAMQRPCVRLSIEHGSGAQTASLDLPASLSSGVYHVLITGRDKVYYKTIIID
jgi:hypothetical protein